MCIIAHSFIHYLTKGCCDCTQECNKARGLLAGVQSAFPEVAQLVRTVQLSHKILFKKGAFIAELAQTGPFPHRPSCLCEPPVCAVIV